MNIITIANLKKHARIDDDVEDDMLELYAESAEDLVLNLLNRDIESLYEEYGKIPKAIEHACLILAAHSFSNREPASIQNLYNVPYTLDALIKPYMIL